MEYLLSDGEASATFDECGSLLGLSRGQAAWRFPEPFASWSLLLEIDGQQRRALPGSGARVERSGATELVVRFDHVTLEGRGDRYPVGALVRWSVSDGLLGAQIELDWPPDAPQLDAAVLPDVLVGYGDGPTSLLIPRETGWEVRDAARAIFTGPGAPGTLQFRTEMQMYAWIEAGRGLYSDCRDEQAHFKSWSFAAEGPGRFRLQVRHPLPRDGAGRRRFILPYRTHLGAFEGGWYEAAQVYRRWAITTAWAGRGPEQRRSDRMADVACWVWNRGLVAQTVEPTLELGRQLGLPVALDWYWWHKHPYDTKYPDYFPPREGERVFRDGVDRLHAAGHFVQVYTNGVLCDVNHPSFGALAAAGGVVGKNGKVADALFNVFVPHRMALMCRAHKGWQDAAAALVDQAAALGLDGLYMDMITSSAGEEICYSASHDHAPGGGCYHAEQFRALLEQVRQRHEGFALTSESVLEHFLDLMTGHITCGISLERFTALVPAPLRAYTHAIPLLDAVYHGRYIGFGSYAAFANAQAWESLWPADQNPDPDGTVDWNVRTRDQFPLELARTVVFGHQPMVANLRMEHLRDERFRTDRQFLLDLCRFYHAHRDWLLWGRLLAPGRLECPQRQREFLQRSIYTPRGQETYLARTGPDVLHSEWRSPDGRCLLVLVNFTREKASLRYVPAQGFALDVGTGPLRLEGSAWVGAIGPMQALALPLAEIRVEPGAAGSKAANASVFAP